MIGSWIVAVLIAGVLVATLFGGCWVVVCIAWNFGKQLRRPEPGPYLDFGDDEGRDWGI